MNIFTINEKEGTLRVFATVRGARNSGNTNLLWASPTELMAHVKKGHVTMDGMLRAYNSSATKPVASFASKQEAVDALFKLAMTIQPEKGQDPSNLTKETDVTDNTNKKPAGKTGAKAGAKTEAKKPAGKTGAKKAPPAKKPDRFAGKKLFAATKDVPAFKEGSKRGAAFAILAKAGKAGIAYEDYQKAGGNAFDLGYFVDHKKCVTAK